MTTFWVLWSTAAIVAIVVLFFFFWGLADGTVSERNMGMWLILLAVSGASVIGSMALKSNGYMFWAKLLACILAIPGFLGLLYILMIIIFKPRWN